MSSNDARRRWGLPIDKNDLDREIAEELAFHLEQRTQRLIDSGLSPAAAQDEAQRRFGSVSGIRAQCVELSEQTERQRLRLQTLGELWSDVRLSLRGLKRRPTFALSAILTLALGIGATTAIYSVLDAVMLRSLPYADAHELVSPWDGVSAQAVVAGLSELEEYESVAAYAASAKTLTGVAEPARLSGADVTTSFFSTLGVAPKIGRSFVAADGEPGAAATVILGEEVWRTRYAGDSGILDTTIRLDGIPHTVVGVMPESVTIPSGDTALWVPIQFSDPGSGNYWGSSYLATFARLAEGTDKAQAEAATKVKAEQLRTTNPIWKPGEEFMQSAKVDSFQGAIAGELSSLLSLLFWAVIAVLLVACVNVANLFLSRGSAKLHETSIKASLGASRLRLLQQGLVEAWVVALCGTLLGLAFAYTLVRWLDSQLPGLSGQFGAVGLDQRVLTFALLLSLVATALFGLVPAIRTTRTANLANNIRGRRSHTARGRTGSFLVIAQLALSVLLLAGAGILLTGVQEQLRAVPGFDPERVVAARLNPAQADYADKQRQVQLYQRVIEELEQLPTVERAAASTTLPFTSTRRTAFDAPDRNFDPNALPFSPYRTVTSGYFETLGIPLLRGRDFNATDLLDLECSREELCAAIIDETLAEQIWPDEDPLGRTIGAYWLGWYRVVGVAAKARLAAREQTTESMLYLPQAQQPQTTLQLAVRTRATTREMESAIAAAVKAVDGQVPVTDVRTIESDIWTSVSRARLATALLSGFAVAALLLAAIGIYGVMSYRADQRRREMGIRLALGSTAVQLQSRELLRVGALCIAGLALGTVAAIAALRYLGASDLLQQAAGRSDLSPALILAVIAILACIGVAAGWIPSKRASHVDPLESLRAE